MPPLRSIRHDRAAALWTWLLIFMFFLAVEWPYARMTNDDWRFAFVCEGVRYLPADPSTPYQPVETVADLFRSVAAHTAHHNGRAPVHLLVQGFVSFWGYAALALFIAFISTAAVEFISRLSVSTGAKVSFLRRMAALTLFCAVMPWFGVFRSWFGGAAFSLNYSLPASLMLAALLMMRRALSTQCRATARHAAGYASVGLIAGLTHEGFAIPLLGALAFMLLRRYRQSHSVPPRALWLLAGTAFGTLAVCIPTIAGRFAAGMGSAGECATPPLLRTLNDMISVVEMYAAIALSVVIACVLLIIPSTRPRAKRAMAACAPYALSAALNIIMITALCYTSIRLLGSTRQFIPAGVMLWMMSMIWASTIIRRRPQRAWRRVVAAVLIGIPAGAGTVWHMQGAESRRLYDDIIEQYTTGADGTVVIADNPYIYERASGLTPRLPVPTPGGAADVAYFERQFIAEHISHAQRPMRFRPDMPDIAAAECLYSDSTVSLYSRPGVWWIIATGLAPDIKAYAYGAKSLRPLRRLFPQHYLLPDHDETALYTDTLTIGASTVTLIGRAPNLESDTLMILHSDGSINLYPICTGIKGK